MLLHIVLQWQKSELIHALTHWPLEDVVVIFKSVISEHMLWIKFMSSSCEVGLMWMPQYTPDDMSTLF